MNLTVKSTLLLAIISLISGISLATIYTITNPKITELKVESQKRALSKVLPGYKITGEKKIKVEGENTKYWIGETKNSGKKQLGYAFISSQPGYSGDIEVMIGVSQNFTIEGVFILQQTETPGLGSRSEEILSDLTLWDFLAGKRETKIKPPWFQEQFKGLKANQKINIVKKGNWSESIKQSLLDKNEITAITGATITTTAVKDAIDNAIDNFKEVVKPASDGV